MRHLSQKLREILVHGYESCMEIVQHDFIEFKAVRCGKYHQLEEAVNKEYIQIAGAALSFEDCHLDTELAKIAEMEIEFVAQIVKKEKAEPTTFTVDLDTKFGFADKVAKKKIDDDRIQIEEQKIIIKKIRSFVQEGCGSSTSSHNV